MIEYCPPLTYVTLGQAKAKSKAALANEMLAAPGIIPRICRSARERKRLYGSSPQSRYICRVTSVEQSSLLPTYRESILYILYLHERGGVRAMYGYAPGGGGLFALALGGASQQLK